MLDIYIAITSFVLRLKIENYKLIIKKKKKKLDKIVLLAKSKLNNMEVLVSKALIDSKLLIINVFFNKRFGERILRYEGIN